MTGSPIGVAGATQRLSIFPLGGALLFPRALLPLHIFEPRYRALVKDALARDRRIAMIQPRDRFERGSPELFEVGCIGRIANVEALESGRFNLVLEGLTRFRVLRELDVATPFRQVEASIAEYDDAAEQPPLALAVRAEIEQEARRYAEARGYSIDWEDVTGLDDEALVNGIAQVAPFDIAAKQALLEAQELADRAELLVQFLRFFGATDDDDDEGQTLQ